MNWKKPAYFGYAALRGYLFPKYFAQYRREWEQGCASGAATACLDRLLRHCEKNVPYYADKLGKIRLSTSGSRDPREDLLRLPVLRKQTIRARFNELQAADISSRKWSYNTSGGSTGEPVRLIQDAEYEDRSKATSLLYYSLLGYEVGEPLVRLWGSERDIEEGTKSPKARFFNWLTETTWMNAFCMSPARMREYVSVLNRVRPRLILAYAQAAYELARFIEQERLPLQPQRAIATSAGTLYPFMREKIAQVFGCKVFNLYGSREVSDIAGEFPGVEGLWVAPWCNYIEILDDAEAPVAPGEEGNIVVTSLTNYAMPLLRYWIGDRGALMPGPSPFSPEVQFLRHVSGRTVDAFRTREQTVVDGEYFTHLLYFRPWVAKFQVIQQDYDRILFRIAGADNPPPASDLEEITAKVRLVMGPRCRVDFEFTPDLAPHPSGKYRYTISEMAA